MNKDELVDYCKKASQTISELDYKNRILEKENQELKEHLKVPKTCNLKTLEDYKSYYEDTTREQILEDTYIEYCAYVNLAHRYSELKKQVEDKILLEMKLENELFNKRKEYQETYKDVRIEIVDMILQKYKEIIGVSNEKK